MELTSSSAPVWQRPATRYPALAGDRGADVVVIGAGIAGLTTAALLAEAGRDVVVLEARTIGSGTSGHTTAKASALQGARYQTIAGIHGGDAAARYARAQLDGLAWVAAHAATVPDARWELRTATSFATTAEGRRTIEQERTAAADAGLAVGDGPVDLPFATTAAVTLADQGQLDPGPYLAALAAEVAASANGAVHEGSRVTGVHGRRGHRVRTEHGTVTADHVVVATLLPITDRGLFFARAEPKSSYLVALDVDGPIPQGMHLSVDEPTRSLRTARHPVDGRELLLVGGEGHHTGNGSPTLPRYQALVDWAQAHFDVRSVVARWTAHDLVPADHLPWVGPASALSPSVLVATGFEKWGMTMGTAAGMALADRILDRDGPSQAWASTFDPHRLAPRGLTTVARLNAQVAGRLTFDWVRPEAPPAPDGTGRRGRAGLVPTGEPTPGGERVHVACTHLGGVCSWNDAERTWDCPLHGSRFEADGTVLAGPAIRPLRRVAPADLDRADPPPTPEDGSILNP